MSPSLTDHRPQPLIKVDNTLNGKGQAQCRETNGCNREKQHFVFTGCKSSPPVTIESDDSTKEIGNQSKVAYLNPVSK